MDDAMSAGKKRIKAADVHDRGTHDDVESLKERIRHLEAEVAHRKDLTQILHALEFPVVQIDADDTIRFHNNAFLEMAQVPEMPDGSTILNRPGNIHYTGHCIHEVLLPEERELLRLTKIAAKAKRLSQAFLYRFGVQEAFTFVSYKGTRTPVNASVTYSHRYDSYQITFIDITDLRESEARFRFLSEATSEAVLVTVNGSIVEANTAACTLFHREKKRLVGADPWSLFTRGSADRVQGELNDGVETPVEATGVVAGGTTFTAQVRTRRLSYGGQTAVVLCIRDISELKETQERFRMAAQIATDLVYEWNPASNDVEWFGDIDRALGFAPDEAPRNLAALRQYAHPDDMSALLRVAARARCSARDIAIEYRMKHADGSWRNWVNRATAVVDENGLPVKWIGVCTDITDRIRAEEQRRRLERQIGHAQKLESLGVLAGGIAHDFNNLLMGVLGNADLALMDLPRTSPVYESLMNIRAASQKAAELSKQMLAYSGRGRFVIEPVSLPQVVREMTNLLEVSTSKNTLVRYDLDERAPVIEGDVAQLQQAIVNLVTNAAEAIGANKGVITMKVGAAVCDREYFSRTYLDENLPEGRYVYVEVSDTGCGMDEETREKLFEPFFTTKFTGRGLGMAAVLGIVRGHGGAVTVYSEPGKGSTIKLLFPAASQELLASGHEAGDRLCWRDGGTILLVDDEETVRVVGERMLRRAGFSPLIASGGEEALRLYHEHRARCGAAGASGQERVVAVILDLTMPGMDGEETFRHLYRESPEIPVIISSGYNESEIMDRFAGRRVAGFIQKPYRYVSLVEKLREVLGEETATARDAWERGKTCRSLGHSTGSK